MDGSSEDLSAEKKGRRSVEADSPLNYRLCKATQGLQSIAGNYSDRTPDGASTVRSIRTRSCMLPMIQSTSA